MCAMIRGMKSFDAFKSQVLKKDQNVWCFQEMRKYLRISKNFPEFQNIGGLLLSCTRWSWQEWLVGREPTEESK